MYRLAQRTGVAAFLLLTAAMVRSETTVAVAVIANDSQDTATQKLAAALPPLLTLALGAEEGLQVVERAELAAIIGELGRGVANEGTENQQPPLGKLDGADLLVGVTLSPAVAESSLYALVRITEGPTAVVRSIRAVPVSESGIEDAVAEIAGLVRTTATAEVGTQPTVAVLPFDSIEQFGRLVPLERGLRDMLATELQRRSRVQVVQRSSMAQLLTELDLVRSGLTNGGRGLDGGPAREPAFVIRGTIDERINEKESVVLIAGELVDAASNQPVLNIEKSCQRSEILDAVAEIAAEVEEVVLRDGDPDGIDVPPAIDTEAAADQLFKRAYTDVARFTRYSPHDAGYLPYRIPGVPVSLWGQVSPDTETGRSALLKAIDRLESALFIDPDRTEATFALAYCCSFHIAGAWDPERCEELLDRSLGESKDERLQKLAYRLKADLYFPHGGRLYTHRELTEVVDQERLLIGYQKRLAIFQSTPESLRSFEWVLLLRMLEHVAEWRHDPELWRPLLRSVAGELDSEEFASRPPGIQDSLRRHATSIAYKISRSAAIRPGITAHWSAEHRQQVPRNLLVTLPVELRKEAVGLLHKWSESPHDAFALAAAEKLHLLKEISLEEYTRRLTEASPGNPANEANTYEVAKIAMQHAREGRPQKGLQLLLSQEPPKDVSTQGYGYFGRALGHCYEALGQGDEALAAYLYYMETADDLYYHGPSLADRIRELGGVPINPERDIDIRYLDDTEGNPLNYTRAALDGDQLYLANGKRANKERRVLESLPVCAVTLSNRTIANLGGPRKDACSVTISPGYLWVGTRSEGLWRRDLRSGAWEHWGMEHGLPTNAVLGVRADGERVIANVAKLVGENQPPESQGPVLIETPPGAPAKFTVLRKFPPLPTTAQTVTIDRNKLVITGFYGRIYTLDLMNGDWSVEPSSPVSAVASDGAAQARPIKDDNPWSGGVWVKPDNGAPDVRFFTEQNHQLWLALSNPLQGFAESGLYRIDLFEGSFHRYGPRDGFRYEATHCAIYGAVAANGGIWLTTPNGLAEVRPRGELAKLLTKSERTNQ